MANDGLISRQALMKEFSDFVRESNNSDFAPTPTWNDAVSLVESMPSAERRGRWRLTRDRQVEYKVCSVCAERVPLNQWRQEWESPFCPSCGARMGAE